MSITYFLGGSLYINLTNRCTADCVFCLRNSMDGVGDADTLWLDAEPSGRQVVDDLLSKDWENAEQIVFCGFGEPTLRLEELLFTAREIKARKPDAVIRVNTNGHANLIYKTDVTPRFKDLVDVLSVSLNYPDGESYERNCKPCFGHAAYQGLLDFATLAKVYVPRVILTAVDVIPEKDIEECRAVAERHGLEFRLRHESR